MDDGRANAWLTPRPALDGTLELAIQFEFAPQLSMRPTVARRRVNARPACGMTTPLEKKAGDLSSSHNSSALQS